MAGPVDQPVGSSGLGRGATIGEILVYAVLNHRVVDLVYQGFRRSVEPYMVGIHQAGEAIVLGYQTAGFSRSGDVPGWRTFILSEIADVAVTDRTFAAPRREFNRDDPRMTEIFARA